MINREKILKIIPGSIIPIIQLIRIIFVEKKSAELSFWKEIFRLEKGKFPNSHYQTLMLAIAEEPNDDFMKGKIVADFGCGPCGSLVWAKSPYLRIGIDVLADKYSDEFTNNIISHEMIYLKSTAHIPQ